MKNAALTVFSKLYDEKENAKGITDGLKEEADKSTETEDPEIQAIDEQLKNLLNEYLKNQKQNNASQKPDEGKRASKAEPPKTEEKKDGKAETNPKHQPEQPKEEKSKENKPKEKAEAATSSELDSDEEERLYDANGETSADNLRSWSTFTQYYIEELSAENGRQAKLNEKYSPEKRAALEALGAYEYVNKGFLAKKYKANKNLPVVYIKPPKNSKLSGEILLAIKANTKNAIEINGAKYQVVGVLGFSSKSEAAQQNYAKIKEDIDKELPDSNTYQTSKKYYNNISQIYSGRIVKNTDEELQDANKLFDGKTYGKDYYFAIYQKGEMKPLGNVVMTDDVPLNRNNMSRNDNSLWLYTQGSDGMWYPKAVTVKLFVDSEYDKEENAGTPLMKQVKELLYNILDKKSTVEKRNEYAEELKTLLYFNASSDIYVDDDGEVILYNYNGDDVTPHLDTDTGNSVTAMLGTLMDEEVMKLRFYISPDSDPEFLVKNNILSTDLAQLEHVNTSFNMYLNETDETKENYGKPIVEEEQPKSEPVSPISSNDKGNVITHRTVTIGKTQYAVYSNGEIRVNGKLTDDEKTIAQAKLALDIETGKELETYDTKGNPIYIGRYGNDKEFGLQWESRSFKVIEGEELAKAKELSEKIRKAMQFPERIKKVVEMLKNMNLKENAELADKLLELLGNNVELLEDNEAMHKKVDQIVADTYMQGLFLEGNAIDDFIEGLFKGRFGAEAKVSTEHWKNAARGYAERGNLKGTQYDGMSPEEFGEMMHNRITTYFERLKAFLKGGVRDIDDLRPNPEEGFALTVGQDGGTVNYILQQIEKFLAGQEEKSSPIDFMAKSFGESNKDALKDIETLHIDDPQEYSKVLTDALLNQNRVINGIGYANTYNNFYIYDVDKDAMPRFVGKVAINDKNRDLINRITNGRGISREDAERIARSMSNVGNEASAKYSTIADYLFQSSRQSDSISSQNERYGSKLIDTIQSYSGRSTPDNRASKAEKEAYDKESARISREIGAIVLNAKKNGTLFKEPNGNDTNLDPVQWIMVRTKNFRNWFGDWYRLETLKEKSKKGKLTAKEQSELEELEKNVSKVVDENGAPLVVYHGNPTSEKITTFDKNKIGTVHEKLIDGFWFISDKHIAKEEYSVKLESFGKGLKGLKYGEVLEVFLNLKDPVIATQKGLTTIDTPIGKMVDADEDLFDFIERVKDDAKDGYILTLHDTDTTETGDIDFMSIQKQFIATDSNQIKSATNNNGRYSENPRIDYLRTKDGIIYGFVHKGKIYINKQKLNPNSLVHEYTHLWCQAVREHNPKLWQSILDVLANDKLAQALRKELKLDETYEHLSEDKLAEEVIAHLSGANGRERMEKIQNELKGETKGLFAKLVESIKQLWNWIGVNLFQMEKLNSLDEIQDRILYDMISKTDLANGEIQIMSFEEFKNEEEKEEKEEKEKGQQQENNQHLKDVFLRSEKEWHKFSHSTRKKQIAIKKES